ncbi:radical SAM protein [Desulfuromonas thiophila]|uniref:radical SAM/SPASM domain-containing protein n=1 Tax=Desulfuromonas thiophila TaxID=57664 RepID=UPI0029F4D815|nr:radical SAM protein [Desulfuromonas thiophila]
MNRPLLSSRFLFNALRYRFHRLTGIAAPLQSISLEVTHRCICRCVMCNIWKIPNDVPDLPLTELIRLLSSPETRSLREIDITGGEPFLRDDLGSLLSWIAQAREDHFPRLKTIAITSNCILTDRVLSTVHDVIESLRDNGIDLVIVCGLDAVGAVHDQIRNCAGAWTKVRTTLAQLAAIRSQYPSLILGVKTTIIPQNVHELDDIAAFAKEQGLFTIISPRIITPNRFGNENLRENLNFSHDDLQAIQAFYQKPVFAWSGHREAMLGYFRSGTINKPCSAGFNTVFVRHTGAVYPCPLIPISLGNIKNKKLAVLLSSAKAARFRQRIKTFRPCKICTEPGLERLAWPYEGWTCLKFALKSPAQFEELVRHMGMDKFF